jgi:YggT family protein
MSGAALAISRADVAQYVEALIYIYIVLIFVRVIASFFTRIPYNRFLDAFLTFVNEVTDPYLNLFRRILPPVRLGPAALDLTPMIGTIVLIFVGLYIVVPLIHG